MLEITYEELANHRTWITDFIFDKSKHEKTFAELEAIFADCFEKLTPALDGTNNDLRILIWQDKMSSGNWTGWVEFERNIRTGNIEEGIHRGIACLRCIKLGSKIDALPKLRVIDR